MDYFDRNRFSDYIDYRMHRRHRGALVRDILNQVEFNRGPLGLGRQPIPSVGPIYGSLERLNDIGTGYANLNDVTYRALPDLGEPAYRAMPPYPLTSQRYPFCSTMDKLASDIQQSRERYSPEPTRFSTPPPEVARVHGTTLLTGFQDDHRLPDYYLLGRSRDHRPSYTKPLDEIVTPSFYTRPQQPFGARLHSPEVEMGPELIAQKRNEDFPFKRYRTSFTPYAPYRNIHPPVSKRLNPEWMTYKPYEYRWHQFRYVYEPEPFSTIKDMEMFRITRPKEYDLLFKKLDSRKWDKTPAFDALRKDREEMLKRKKERQAQKVHIDDEPYIRPKRDLTSIPSAPQAAKPPSARYESSKSTMDSKQAPKRPATPPPSPEPKPEALKSPTAVQEVPKPDKQEVQPISEPRKEKGAPSSQEEEPIPEPRKETPAPEEPREEPISEPQEEMPVPEEPKEKKKRRKLIMSTGKETADPISNQKPKASDHEVISEEASNGQGEEPKPVATIDPEDQTQTPQESEPLSSLPVESETTVETSNEPQSPMKSTQEAESPEVVAESSTPNTMPNPSELIAEPSEPNTIPEPNSQGPIVEPEPETKDLPTVDANLNETKPETEAEPEMAPEDPEPNAVEQINNSQESTDNQGQEQSTDTLETENFPLKEDSPKGEEELSEVSQPEDKPNNDPQIPSENATPAEESSPTKSDIVDQPSEATHVPETPSPESAIPVNAEGNSLPMADKVEESNDASASTETTESAPSLETMPIANENTAKPDEILIQDESSALVAPADTNVEVKSTNQILIDERDLGENESIRTEYEIEAIEISP